MVFTELDSEFGPGRIKIYSSRFLLFFSICVHKSGENTDRLRVSDCQGHCGVPDQLNTVRVRRNTHDIFYGDTAVMVLAMESQIHIKIFDREGHLMPSAPDLIDCIQFRFDKRKTLDHIIALYKGHQWAHFHNVMLHPPELQCCFAVSLSDLNL